MLLSVITGYCVRYDTGTCGELRGVRFVGSIVSQSMMSIVVFVILLRLLVARAINARVESPPRLVLLTGRR